MTVYRRPDPIPIRRAAPTAAGMMPSAVRSEPEDLNRLVAKEIFRAITSGRFPVGSILPNEHQLANDLGVSRTALREAIKGLVSKGLVETRRKRGTLVLDQSNWNMLDAEVIAWTRRDGNQRISEELWSALAATQPTLAGLAAGSRTSVTLEKLATAFERAADAAARRTAFGEFLVNMSSTSGNRFLASLTASCLRSLLLDDPAFLDRKIDDLQDTSLSKLVATIRAGDVPRSRVVAQECFQQHPVLVI